MVSLPVSGSSGPGSSPGWGHCVVSVLGQDNSLLHCLFPPRCINGYRRISMLEGNPAMDCDGIPSMGK